MNQRNAVIMVELIANIVEGIILTGYVFDVWFISLKLLLVASYIIEGPFLVTAWLKLVDTKSDS